MAYEAANTSSEMSAQVGMVPPSSDPIRVVPLHIPSDLTAPLPSAGPAPAPHLTYRGGPLLANVEVFTVFWGAAWQQAPLDATINQLNQFFDNILQSPLIDQLAEYNAPPFIIGHGRRTGTATVITPALARHTVTDQAIQHMLQQAIAANAALPQPTPNSLYFVYLPPGVSVVQGGTHSCKAFCGYHDAINSTIFYAAMPYPNCQGCIGNLAAFDALTSTSSHELCEAITDPIPGQGWYDDNHGEIGDICAWQTKKVGDYTVQLEWSNAANSCT